MIAISRIADLTIKGFLYQFNLTLNELLVANDDAIVQVEGIIEDIDIIQDKGIVAVQCKYHEQQDTYSLSKIYKPVLQMLKTHIESNGNVINFILYAYFPSETEREITLNEDDILNILRTTNVDYISKYICKISPPTDPLVTDICIKERKSNEDKSKIKEYYQNNPVQLSESIREFVNTRLKIKFGESYESLELRTKSKLVEVGLNKDDVEELLFPNAIHKIAVLSTNPIDDDRKIRRREFVDDLIITKKIAISRWTRELKNYKQLLTSRRNQLSTNLNQNNRKRYFLININNIENFNNDIVIFLKDFTEIYCHKPKLHQPALFCLSNSSMEIIYDVEARLYTKSVEVQTGYKGNKFFADALLKNPERKVKDNWIEFKARLCCETDEIIELLNANKPDDLYVISKSLDVRYELQDINVEFLDIQTFNELKYLLKMTKEVQSNE